MAIIKKSELKNMNVKILESKLNDLRKELVKINAQISTNTPPENPGRVKEIKRTIARILTRLKLQSIIEDKKPKEETVKA